MVWWTKEKQVKPEEEEHHTATAPQKPLPKKRSGKSLARLSDTRVASPISEEPQNQLVKEAGGRRSTRASSNFDEADLAGYEGSVTTAIKAKPGPETGQVFFDEDRPLWNTRYDFIITMIGFSLDLSNIWRFPCLCFKYKGLVFLVPYIFLTVFMGFPIFYLELIIGQFVRQGCTGIWKICPAFRGVGYATLFITYIVIYTYNVSLAWALHFAINSWIPTLPWSSCNNTWNTRNCLGVDNLTEQTQRAGILSGYEYFHGKVLGHYDASTNASYSLVNLGGPDTDNVIYLTVIYILLVIVLARGIRNAVGIMWYTSGSALVILCILLFRGLTLQGSPEGFKYFASVDSLKNLINIQMWVDAGAQVFYSLGIGFGAHVSFASLNPFHHDMLRDCIIVIGFNVAISLISSLAVYGFLGHSAFFLREEHIDDIYRDKEILFEVFPDVLARLKAYNFYSFSFYFMLFCISFSCVLSGLHCIRLCIKDDLKALGNSYGCKACVTTTMAAALAYGVGIICLTRGGIDVFNLIDENVAVSSLFLCVFLQLVGISWFYGVNNICRAVEAMNGTVPSMWLRLSWKIITPLLLILLIIAEIWGHRKVEGTATAKKIKIAISSTISWFPLAVIIAVCIYKMWSVRGPSKWVCFISPEPEHSLIRKFGGGYRSFRDHWAFLGTSSQMKQAMDMHADSKLQACLVSRNKNKPEQNNTESQALPKLPLKSNESVGPSEGNNAEQTPPAVSTTQFEKVLALTANKDKQTTAAATTVT